MIISHQKVANAAVDVLSALTKNHCNAAEAREAMRAANSQIENTELASVDYTSSVFSDLSRRYDDDNLSECTEGF